MNAYLSRLLRHFEAPERPFATMVRGEREQVIAWGDLRESARAFLGAYRAAGVAPGGTILIFLRHVPELYGSFFGAMLGGFVPSFMPCPSPRQDPALYWVSHRQLLDRIAPGLIVADRATLADMAAHGIDGVPALPIDAVRASDAPWSIPPGDRIGLLQHSSGTTGLKKGVALTYDALARQAETYAATLKLAPRDTIVSWLPLYHDMGLIACLVMPAFADVPIVQLDPFEWTAEPSLLFAAIERHGGTLCWLPNFAFDHLAAVAGRRGRHHDLRSVRAFIDCSEPCQPASLDRFAASFDVAPAQLQCCYAMAETVFAATQTALDVPPTRLRVRRESLERGHRIERDPAGIELIESGAPLHGVALSVQGETGEALAEGYVGEIVVRGPFLFSGYNKLPEKTAEQLVDGAYRTGDLGFLREGRLYVLGRVDDAIVVNGRNLYAHEIETIVSGIEGVKPGRAVAVGRFDPRLGTQALIVIAERAGHRADAAIADELSRSVFSMTGAMPRAIHLVAPGWLIKTTSGKISRAANLKKLIEAETAPAKA